MNLFPNHQAMAATAVTMAVFGLTAVAKNLYGKGCGNVPKPDDMDLVPEVASEPTDPTAVPVGNPALHVHVAVPPVVIPMMIQALTVFYCIILSTSAVLLDKSSSQFNHVTDV